MNRSIFAPFVAALLISAPAWSQTAPTFMSPIAINSAGSYPATGISVGPPNNTAVVELQATGSGTGLSFSVTGTPIGSTTAVTLKMYTAPACAATVTSGTANGDWFIPVAGFTNINLVVASVTGSETFGITASNQPNCANVAGAPVTTTPSGSAIPATGTIANTGDSVTLSVASSAYGTFGVQAVGTWSGALIVEGSVDGTNYTPTTVSLLSSGQPSSSLSSAGAYQGNMAGLKSVRVRAISMASGSVAITISGSPGTAQIMQDNIPWYTVPGQQTYVGQQCFTTAALASSTALTIPATATTMDLYPECSANGTDNMCIRFNPAGAALSAGGPGWASQQNQLGQSTSGGSWHVILDATATGPAGSNNALCAVYWK